MVLDGNRVSASLFCGAAGRIVRLDDAVDGDAYENGCRGGGVDVGVVVDMDIDIGIDMDRAEGRLVTVAAVVAVSAVLLLKMLAVLTVDENEAVAAAGLPLFAVLSLMLRMPLPTR